VSDVNLVVSAVFLMAILFLLIVFLVWS